MKAINRIYKYIDYKSISVAEFERLTSISNGYLSKMKRRSAGVGEDILNSILEKCPEISPEWLLTGNGDMIRSKEKPDMNIQQPHHPASPDKISDPKAPPYNKDTAANLRTTNKENKTTAILNRLKKHYNIASDTGLAKFLNIAPTTLSSWKSRDSFDYDLVYSKCEDVDGNWLLTGEGPMLKSESTKPVAVPAKVQGEGIPLIPVSAMAGFFAGEVSILELECERYVVPLFKDAEFLIQVRGSSMYPKYSAGDVVACKKLSVNNLFFQWNKVYVLDTDQGALIKRVKKSANNNHILVVSDNPQYEQFELSLENVYSVAIVIGVIRLE